MNPNFNATAAASRYLRLDSPAGIAWLLRHHNDLAAAWAGLDQVLRCGRPARPARSSTAGPAEPETFIHAMHDNARQRAPILARLLAGQPITRMLDVGGGSGAYCLEFCRRRPRLQATLFDRADVLRVARKILAGHRQARRIDLLAGDLDTDQLPGGFDFVLLSQVIHSAGPAQIRRWLSKIRRALQPGGLLAIQDFLTDPTGTRPRRAAVFAINMLVNTPAGRTYSRRELSTWLRRAGFVGIRSVDSTDAAIALMLARRPDR
ncbi:MAG: methyltransferase [Phycisphaerae bacterium]